MLVNVRDFKAPQRRYRFYGYSAFTAQCEMLEKEHSEHLPCARPARIRKDRAKQPAYRGFRLLLLMYPPLVGRSGKSSNP